MVGSDTISGLFPQVQEEPADEFRLLESGSSLWQPRQRLVHLGGEAGRTRVERLLGDRDVDDDTLGFHAQQAAEKPLKAALSSRKADYPRTHNLGVLIELVSGIGVELPPDLVDIDRLTPFGTVFRYDEVLPQGGQDRSRWLGWIRGPRAFVEATIG